MGIRRFGKIAGDTVDVDQAQDKNLNNKAALSEASRLIRDTQFINERSFGRDFPAPRTGAEAERIRRILLEREKVSKTKLADASRPAPADINNLKARVGTTSFANTILDAVGGTAINRDGTSGRKPISDSSPPKIVPLPQFGNEVPDIPDNVLNDYINLQYHLILSMLPMREAVAVQVKIPLASSSQSSQTTRGFDELRGELESQTALPLASTGDVFQDDNGIDINIRDLISIGELPSIADRGDPDATLRRGTVRRNYYNITNLTLENVMSPSVNNSFIADMINSKMTLVEPHGFNFHEDVRAMGDQLGYKEINAGRIIYRLDIFYSGYNQDTGEWIPFIPINVRNGTDKVKIITYYLNISKIEANVSHTGTTYSLDLVPAAHIAWRPEEMTLEAGTTITGGFGNDGKKRQTFGGFLESLSTTMNTACRERTHGQIEREYEFIAPTQLSEASFYEQTFTNQHGFLKQNRQGETVIAQGRDVDVITVLKAALKDMTYTWDLFLKEDDQQHITPRILWSIRFNAVYEGGAHSGLYDFRKIKLQYIIEPFATFKKGTAENREDVSAQVDLESQVSRVEEMVRLGMINRVYDYIHTSKNTEVINFDINLKAFYFLSLNTFMSNQSNTGEAEREAVANQTNKNETKRIVGKEVKPTGDRPPLPSSIRISTNDAIRSIFGGDNRPKVACLFGNQTSPYDITGGGFHEAPKSDVSGAIASSDDIRRSKYDQQLADHLRNDLLILENFEVRGDPLWLLSPYANHSGTVLASQADSKNGINGIGIVQTRSSKVIFLRMFAPVQDDLMNPDRPPAGVSCSIIGGFYEIRSVTSKFEGGKFTQVLQGAKIENLNYVENFVDVGALRGRVGDAVVSTDAATPLRASLPNDSIGDE